MLRKVLCTALAAALVFNLAACTPSQTQDTPAPSAAASEPASSEEAAAPAEEGAEPADGEMVMDPADLKVAILIPSSPTDGGWGQIGADSMTEACAAFGLKPVIIEAATADLMKSEVETLGAEGFHIIFGHGGQYSAPFAEVCEEFPEIVFITSGGNVVTDNVFPFHVVAEQATYMFGVMAAKLTKTNKLGYIVGGDYPAYTKALRGFYLGAKSVNPDIEVLSAVVSDSTDMNEAYELSISQINAGADIVSANANQSAFGTIKAAKEHGLYTFGNAANVNNESDEFVIASWVSSNTNIYKNVINDYLHGKKPTGVIPAGFEDEGLLLYWNELVMAKLPPEVASVPDELLPKLIAGEITVPNEMDPFSWDQVK